MNATLGSRPADQEKAVLLWPEILVRCRRDDDPEIIWTVLDHVLERFGETVDGGWHVRREETPRLNPAPVSLLIRTAARAGAPPIVSLPASGRWLPIVRGAVEARFAEGSRQTGPDASRMVGEKRPTLL